MTDVSRYENIKLTVRCAFTVAVVGLLTIWILFVNSAENEPDQKENTTSIAELEPKTTFIYFTPDNEAKAFTVENSSGSNVNLSKNGEVALFYAKDSEDQSILYYFYTFEDSPTPKAIGSGISLKELSEDGRYITYRKDNVLYQFDIKASSAKTIAENVSAFSASPDGKRIYYYTKTENKLECFLYREETGVEKLGDNLSECYISEDYQKFYYSTPGGSLCLKQIGKDRKIIATDVSNVTVYPSGEAYITMSDKNSVNNSRSTYYYDGENLIDTGACEPVVYGCSKEGTPAAVCYSKSNIGEEPYCLVVKGEIVKKITSEELGGNKINNIQFDTVNGIVYFTDGYNDTDKPNKLYSISYGEKTDDRYQVKLCAENVTVDTHRQDYVFNGNLMYSDNGLHINGQLVSCGYRNCEYNYVKDEFVYLEFDKNDQNKDLKRLCTYSDGEVKVVADCEERVFYDFAPNGHIIYTVVTSDYPNYAKDVYVYDGEKSVKVKENVKSLAKYIK